MKHMAPYQIFFPFGVLAALLGVGFWLVPDQVIFGTPIQWVHSRLMVGGFLWGFITGFLMTAVPKMTGTAGATRTEMLTAAGLLSLSLLTSFFADGRWFQASQILVILFMMSFAFPRIGRRAKPAPVFFSHVALALILALSGRVFAFMGNSWMGFFLADVGVVLLLVLGIGMRFYSFLSGLPSEFEQAPVVHQRGFHFLGIALSLFLVLAGWLQAPWAYGGLFVITAAYLVFVWKVFRRSSRPSALKWSVRLVAFSIPLSFLFCAFFPGLYLAGLHVLFIGVFSLITFSV
ncbi:MAG: NnrS family protein, partial [Bdellovibrionaceae bacterium]|nr:NnrS family protein [Pseudobdellovibrionaceae bacterium]